ncbi:MAG: hypothetical protein EKK46_09425 [Rhodocyclaceae bacterium]|nr:MAG: hypothetical protein EKK46_09425 [Rhodocyclaceae bacterium]
MKIVSAWVAVLLTAQVALAQVPSYSADVKALQQAINLDSVRGTFNAANANQILPSMGTMPQDLSKFSVTSPQEMAQKGANQLAWCVNTPKKSMTDLQKAQCDAAVAAAGAASERSQYDLTPNRATSWIGQSEQSSRLRVKTDPTLGGNTPVYTVQQESCTTSTNVLPVVTVPETCSSTLASSGQTCTETLSVTVTITYTVTVTDSVTGAVTTIGTTTDQTQADAWVAANPGAVSDRRVDTQDNWSTDCATLASNQMCDFDGETCTLGPATRTINGESVTRACWQKTKGFTCYAAATNTCGSLIAQGCTQTNSTCAATRANGDCVDVSYDYSCPSGAPRQTSQTNCTGGKICFGTQCFDTSKHADSDFAAAMTYMEAAREGSVYMDGSGGQVELFKGQGGSCTKPTGPGIGSNCCKSSGGAVTNNQAMGGVSATSIVGGVVVSTVLSNAISIGSHYMYDFMFQTDGWLQEKAFAAINNSDAFLGGWNPDAAFMDLLQSPSFSMYGFTVTSSTASIIPGTMTVPGMQNLFGTSYQLTFNPYVFAAMIALNVISELYSCSQDEEMLSMRRGAGLCAKTGEYCSARLPWPLKTCIQKTETWCCWNSKLAKSISMQAKCQLYGYCGGNPGNCSGFSAAEFARIDFSKLDLSEFTNEIQANVSSYESVASPTVIQALQNKMGSSMSDPTKMAPNAGANSTLSQ